MAGQILLVVLNEGGALCALYAFDGNNKPYQIYGLRDLLLGQFEITDASRDVFPVMTFGTTLVRLVFEELSLDELIDHAHVLQEWEGAFLSSALHSVWAQCPSICAATIESLSIPVEMKCRLLAAVENHKASIGKDHEARPAIDLSDYTAG